MNKEKTAIGKLKNDFDKNVFVMMRYRDNPKFTELELVIRESFENFGLKARLAKDKAYCDDIWDNIKTYMENSKYGVVVFEEIDEREYNPNISMELGYMYALGNRCLLLKDKRMPTLPTDICGKIYRNFDTYNIIATVSNEIQEWCEKDLGLEKKGHEKIYRSELALYIAENIDSIPIKFKKRPSWEEYISIVNREYDGEETTYVIWNEKSEKIYKYYKYGVSWDGPHNLNKSDESKIRKLLEIE